MKCIECGSEWNTKGSSIIDTCPFCGAKLHNINTVGDALKWILSEKGVSVFNNGSLINSMLADLAKDKEKERNKIRLALSSGAGALFYKLYTRNNGAFHDTEIKEFQTSLEEFGFADDFSVFVLTTFLYAVGTTMNNTVEQISSCDNIDEPSTQQLNNFTNTIQNQTVNQDNNDLYTVKLLSVGYEKIKTIKAIREIGFGLKETKDFVDEAPVSIVDNITYREAEKIKNHIEQYGAKVCVEKTQFVISAIKKARSINDSEINTKFMMNIEDTFTIIGRGTVIVGTVLIGIFSIGDVADIILYNGNAITTTITGIEMFKKSISSAQMGDNVGVFLRGVKKDDIIGAKALVNQGAKVFHKNFTAEIHLLDKNEGGRHKPIFDHYCPCFKFATTATRGIMTFTKKIEMLIPGSDATIRADLDDNVIIAPGMSFVIHEGDNRTVAKGKILDVF